MEDTEVLALIPKHWHDEFRKFIDTGDADDAFLAFLDNDENGQRAVEAAFSARVGVFEEFAQTLRPELLVERRPDPALLSAQMKNVLETTVSLPPQQRRDVIADMFAAVRRMSEPDKREVRAIGKELAKV